MWRIGLAKRSRKRTGGATINATHLLDWLHNEHAHTDDPEAERVYRETIAHVEAMRDGSA
jgi:hypothetical protein